MIHVYVNPFVFGVCMCVYVCTVCVLRDLHEVGKSRMYILRKKRRFITLLVVDVCRYEKSDVDVDKQGNYPFGPFLYRSMNTTNLRVQSITITKTSNHTTTSIEIFIHKTKHDVFSSLGRGYVIIRKEDASLAIHPWQVLFLIFFKAQLLVYVSFQYLHLIMT